MFHSLQQRSGRLPVSHIILGMLGVAGLVSVALLAPNAVQMLRNFDPLRWSKDNPKYRVHETLRRLKKEGLVELTADGADTRARLTAKGKSKLQAFSKKLRQNRNMTVWDGKWRVVIFDIEEYKKKMRDYFRAELAGAGFQKLQNSVWVSPYECEEMIALFKTDLKLDNNVLYFVTDKMEGDQFLRNMFFIKR